MLKIIGLSLISLALASCASISEKDCLSKNWYQQGMTDAKAGEPKSNFGEYKETCLRHGVSFDKEEYIQGYESGITGK